MRRDKQDRRLSARRVLRRLAPGCLALAAFALVLLGLEGCLWLFWPQPMMTPRYDFTASTGIINFGNVRMRHRQPGVYDYTYTVNQDRYRGRQLPFQGSLPRIVVLGDSHSFGIGVQDEETYSRRLQRRLEGQYDVVNLANGGWGLTHEIARFLAFGERFGPWLVVLQFCENDLEDNALTPLIAWDESSASWAFRRAEQRDVNRFRSIVSWSRPVYGLLTGHSQTYNFARDRIYRLVAARDRSRNEAAAAVADREAVHAALLTRFAEYLQGRAIGLVLISVQEQLERHPLLLARVRELEQRELLRYLDTRLWFAAGDFPSPEGHPWGAEAHRRIAEGLAVEVARRAGAPASAPQPR